MGLCRARELKLFLELKPTQKICLGFRSHLQYTHPGIHLGGSESVPARLGGGVRGATGDACASSESVPVCLSLPALVRRLCV